jgi:hypothetical protein
LDALVREVKLLWALGLLLWISLGVSLCSFIEVTGMEIKATCFQLVKSYNNNTLFNF